MSLLVTHSRKIIGFGALAGAAYYFNFLRTPGVNNIEKRFSSGGATPNHTPATATPRGNSNQVIGNQDSHKGLGTPTHEEKIGEQRPQGTAFSKAFEKQKYPDKGNGADKGLK